MRLPPTPRVVFVLGLVSLINSPEILSLLAIQLISYTVYRMVSVNKKGRRIVSVKKKC